MPTFRAMLLRKSSLNPENKMETREGSSLQNRVGADETTIRYLSSKHERTRLQAVANLERPISAQEVDDIAGDIHTVLGNAGAPYGRRRQAERMAITTIGHFSYANGDLASAHNTYEHLSNDGIHWRLRARSLGKYIRKAKQDVLQQFLDARPSD
jgi:hypothetical protein